jgi:hypothetical protein
MKIARHRGIEKAIVALARRLAVIMHRIWVDGTEFRWTKGGRRSVRAVPPGYWKGAPPRGWHVHRRVARSDEIQMRCLDHQVCLLTDRHFREVGRRGDARIEFNPHQLLPFGGRECLLKFLG